MLRRGAELRQGAQASEDPELVQELDPESVPELEAEPEMPETECEQEPEPQPEDKGSRNSYPVYLMEQQNLNLNQIPSPP